MSNTDNKRTSFFSFSLGSKLSFAILSVLLFSISLNTTLNYLNFEKRLAYTSDSIYDIVLEESSNDINQAISLGLPLAAISNIQALLERRFELVSGITFIAVESAQGKVLFQTGSGPNGTDRQLSTTIKNTFGIIEGKLKLYYSVEQLNQQKNDLLNKQLINAVITVFLAALCGFVALKFLLSGISKRINDAGKKLSEPQQAPLNKLINAQKALYAKDKQSRWAILRDKNFPLLVIILAMFLTITANVVSSSISLNSFSKVYASKIEQKSNLLGDTLATMITRLLDKGVPIDRLHGIEDEFSFYTDNHEEVTAITLKHSDSLSYQYALPNQQLENQKSNLFKVGKHGSIELNISTDDNIILSMLKERLMDMLTVLVASCLVVSEIILFMCNFMIISPWRQVKKVFLTVNRDMVNHIAKVSSRDEIGLLLEKTNKAIIELKPQQISQQIDSQNFQFIRLPLFILVFAEATSLAFFPSYVSLLENTSGWIPENLVISLPISLFMLCWAISLPFAGYWSDKVGRRVSLMTGAMITSVGLLLTAFTQTLEMLLVVRAFTAIGYGIVFIAAQGYVSDTTNSSNRTKGMATFLSAFFSGSLCGASIGGIFADKFGYSTTFIFAALLAFSSIIIVALFFERVTIKSQTKPVKLADFKLLLRNKYFTLITLFSAIPAKVILTGFLYYICPVYLQSLGESSSSSGRIMMAYGLAIIIISPIAATLIEKRNKVSFILVGGLIASIALLSMHFVEGTLGVLIIVIAIGLAHGISVSPQIPLVIEMLEKEGIERGKIIGIFRLSERIGNVSGPLLAGLALTVFSYKHTIMLFGAGLLISTFALLLFFNTFAKLDAKRI